MKGRQDAHILGVGLDGAEGEVRMTRGDNFRLVGGSEETHERMTESCIKFNEKLGAAGKTLAQLGRSELADMAAECEMNFVDRTRGRSGHESQ